MSTQTLTAQVTPFISATELRCVLGSDYKESLGNAVHFTCATWTNLASGAVSVRYLDQTVVVTGTVVTAGIAGTTQEIYFELTRATLETLGKGRHNLRLVASMGGLDYAMHDFWLSVT